MKGSAYGDLSVAMETGGRWRFLKSKEAIIVIVWYAVISLWLQGNSFAPMYYLNLSNQYGQWTYAIGITLSYPVIGLLADMWIGRYKLISFSLWLKWITVMIVTLTSSLIVTFKLSLVLNNVILIILTALDQIGFSSFQVTAIQFGTDQLQEAPKKHLSSFIFWYIFVEQIATPITEWVNYMLYFSRTLDTLIWVLLAWSIFVGVLLTVVLSTKNCFMSGWFVREPGTPNPYRLVYHVIKFAWKHKHPVQRSALAHGEDKQPSRLDYGMCKYGGPFTAEEVNNVKKLLKLTAVLLSLFGMFVVIFSIQSDWQGLVMAHIGGRTPTYSFPQLIEASCDTVVLVLLIPLHELIIYPFFHKYIPSMIKRIWIGAALYILCTFSILVVDAVGHSLNTPVAIDCFRLDNPEINSTVILGVSHYVLLVPTTLYGLATIVFHTSLIEFIIIRSPHSMKGMLLGLYYTLRYGITECFPLSLQYAFAYHSRDHYLSCASSYFLLLMIIAILSLAAFTAVSYKFKDWDTNEEICVHPFVEDYDERNQ